MNEWLVEREIVDIDDLYYDNVAFIRQLLLTNGSGYTFKDGNPHVRSSYGRMIP